MTAELVATLRKVDYLAMLDDAALTELVAGARVVRYAPGDFLVSELDPGADVFVIVAGEASVFVEPRAGERRVLGTLGPGTAFGEMASLTSELRSASVAAVTAVQALVIADGDFDRLRARRPEVAVALVQVLGVRLAAAEHAIDALLADTAARPLAGETARTDARRGSIARAWREHVVSRGRDLTFLTLAAFSVSLLVVRAVVALAFHFDLAARAILRAAYLSGFALLVVSAACALLTYRPTVRRAVALAYGVGCALILNELGVTLAFDIFFKDIHTADPNAPFDIERLYRRAEPIRAITIGLLVLVQAAYLRPFYRRAGFVVTTRLRKLLSRS